MRQPRTLELPLSIVANEKRMSSLGVSGPKKAVKLTPFNSAPMSPETVKSKLLASRDERLIKLIKEGEPDVQTSCSLLAQHIKHDDFDFRYLAPGRSGAKVLLLLQSGSLPTVVKLARAELISKESENYKNFINLRMSRRICPTGTECPPAIGGFSSMRFSWAGEWAPVETIRSCVENAKIPAADLRKCIATLARAMFDWSSPSKSVQSLAGRFRWFENNKDKAVQELVAYQSRNCKSTGELTAIINRKKDWDSLKLSRWSAGLCHGDLNFTNVLCIKQASGANELCVIDFANVEEDQCPARDWAKLERDLKIKLLQQFVPTPAAFAARLKEVNAFLAASDRRQNWASSQTALCVESISEIRQQYYRRAENSSTSSKVEYLYFLLCWNLAYLLDDEYYTCDPIVKDAIIGSASDMLNALNLEISHIDRDQAESTPTTPRKTSDTWSRHWISLSAVVLFIAVLILGYIRYVGSDSTRRPTFVSFELPASRSFTVSGIAEGFVAISPNGEQLAYVAPDAGGEDSLWIRPLKSDVAQILAYTEGATQPFWAPNSQSIGFFADGQLKVVALSDRRVRVLYRNAPSPHGGAWSGNDTIIFAPAHDSPLYEIGVDGINFKPVSKLDSVRGEMSHRWPSFMSDGTHFTFLAQSPVSSGSQEAEQFRLKIGFLGSDTATAISLSTTSNVIYEDGFLLFLIQHKLWAHKFDSDRLELRGELKEIADDVECDFRIGRGMFSASQNGILTFQKVDPESFPRLVSVSHTGKVTELFTERFTSYTPRISPDGAKLALDIADRSGTAADLWVYDFAHRTKVLLVKYGESQNLLPVWSPNGKAIIFASNRTGHFNLYEVPSDGSRSERQLLSSEADQRPTGISPDGRFLVFDQKSSYSSWGIYLLDLRRRSTVSVFRQTEKNQRGGEVSPDGHWIAYASDEADTGYDVYVASFAHAQERVRVSLDGGTIPKWSPDGTKLFYLSLDGKLMTASIRRLGSRFDPGEGTLAIKDQGFRSMSSYDVSPDSTRFIMNMPMRNGKPVKAIFNWDDLP